MALLLRKLVKVIYEMLYIRYLLFQCARAVLIQTNGNIFACIVTDQLGFYCHYYYVLNKYSDLLETVIFVFRKKNRQISFLHVYHHCAVILASTMAMQVSPGNYCIVPKIPVLYDLFILLVFYEVL